MIIIFAVYWIFKTNLIVDIKWNVEYLILNNFDWDSFRLGYCIYDYFFAIVIYWIFKTNRFVDIKQNVEYLILNVILIRLNNSISTGLCSSDKFIKEFRFN